MMEDENLYLVYRLFISRESHGWYHLVDVAAANSSEAVLTKPCDPTSFFSLVG